MFFKEATTRLELVMRVLQTLALPTWPRRRVNQTRAGNGIRTRDLLLGKETFYQLNHARKRQIYFVNVFASIALVKKIVKRLMQSPMLTKPCQKKMHSVFLSRNSGMKILSLKSFSRKPLKSGGKKRSILPEVFYKESLGVCKEKVLVKCLFKCRILIAEIMENYTFCQAHSLQHDSLLSKLLNSGHMENFSQE